jgi:hypothetical protein
LLQKPRFPLPVAASATVGSMGCCNSTPRVLIYVAHVKTLGLPICHRILDDAENLDPDIFLSKGLSNDHRLCEGLWQVSK